jgi:broad specificity phosphatase PhoE
LTPAGREYSRRLATFAKEEIASNHSYHHDRCAAPFNSMAEEAAGPGDGSADDVSPPVPKQRPCRLWTSTLRRTQETAQFMQHDTINHTFDNGDTLDWVQFRMMPRRNLDELYAGTCDGMTYKEIQQVFPEEFSRRQADKLSYRYPRGESYMDVTLRLEPLAQEMERTREPVLIIGHQGILRILYAYFMGLDRKEAPYVSIPLNNVIKLTPHAYGCHEKRYCLMMKEEMLKDGQDEPVTSMPMGPDDPHKNQLHGGPTVMMTTSFGDNVPDVVTNHCSSPTLIAPTPAKEAASVRAINSEYSPSDPIMNAPSC